jgi:hypothetical protein
MKENDKQLTNQNKTANVKSIDELVRLADAEASKSIEQEFDFDKELSEEERLTISMIKDTQNPAVSYKLFYAIQALMKQFLPKGPDYKDLRDYTYELKNILLTQGKNKNEKGIRGGDARQAYIAGELNVIYDLMMDWVRNGATAAYLIDRLQKLNEERGYQFEGSGIRRNN